MLLAIRDSDLADATDHLRRALPADVDNLKFGPSKHLNPSEIRTFRWVSVRLRCGLPDYYGPFENETA